MRDTHILESTTRRLRRVWAFAFAGATMALVGATPPAQEPVCASCMGADRYTYYEEDGSSEENGDGHAFVYGEDGCVGGFLPTWCVRCGGSGSTCHEEPQTGPCHIPCGPTGDAFAVMTEIKDALDRDDVALLAAAVSRDRVGVSAEFIPDGGRIDLILPCDPSVAYQTIPVLPRVNAELTEAPRAASGVITTP